MQAWVQAKAGFTGSSFLKGGGGGVSELGQWVEVEIPVFERKQTIQAGRIWGQDSPCCVCCWAGTVTSIY